MVSHSFLSKDVIFFSHVHNMPYALRNKQDLEKQKKKYNPYMKLVQNFSTHSCVLEAHEA